jgi:hypothetical protein
MKEELRIGKIKHTEVSTEECGLKRKICEIERRRLLCRLSECSRSCQKVLKHRFWGNNFFVQAHQLERTIAKHIVDAARLNGASGARDIDGPAAGGSGSESGEERINLLPSVVTRCGNWKKRPTGWTCSWTEASLRQKNFRASGGSATNSSPFS